MKRESTKLWAIALLPMILLLAGIAGGAWKEYRAWTEIRPELEEGLASLLTQSAALRAKLSERPIDEVARDHRRNQQDLGLMINDLSNQASRDEILNRSDGTPILVPPGKDWPEAPLYRRLASQAEPLVDLLEEMTERQLSGGPTEHSIPRFESQTQQSVLRIVLVDAFYRSDFEEAHRLFNLMANQLSLLSIDGNVSLQSQALLQQLEVYQTVQESLAHDPWTESQLERFTEILLRSLRLADRMEAARRHQKSQIVSNTLGIYQNTIAAAIGVVDQGISWSVERDSIHITNVLSVLQSPYGLQEIRDYSDIYPSVARLNEKWKPIARGGTFSPTLPNASFHGHYLLSETMQLAISLAIAEDMRRLTLTAIEIKRYQKREGRWPDQLSDLTTTEPASQTTTSISGKPFTYAIISDPEASGDGELAAVIQNDDATTYSNNLSPAQSSWPVYSWHRTRGHRSVMIR